MAYIITLIFLLMATINSTLTRVDNQAEIKEIASLVQSAIEASGDDVDTGSSSDVTTSLSNSEINEQIHSTLKEAIRSEEKETPLSSEQQEAKPNSKLGFLQKVITLDCFFGGSDCLFSDKKSMMTGQVTDYAKKKFQEGNTDVNQYLKDMKQQMTHNLMQSKPKASENKLKEAQLTKQLQDSLKGLQQLEKKSDLPSLLTQTAVSQSISVPVDHFNALSLKVIPNFEKDAVQSVILNSYKKIESQDKGDFYKLNIEVMVKRQPKETSRQVSTKMESTAAQAPSLNQTVSLHQMPMKELTVKDILTKLEGKNITKQSLMEVIYNHKVSEQKVPTNTTSLVNTVLSKKHISGPEPILAHHLDIEKPALQNVKTKSQLNPQVPSTTKTLAQKKSQLVNQLLELEKSDPASLIELFNNNKTRDSLNNLLKDKPTAVLTESEDEPMVLPKKFSQESSSMAKMLLKLDKYDLENLGSLFENNKTRDAYKDLIIGKSSLLKLREEPADAQPAKLDTVKLSQLFDETKTDRISKKNDKLMMSENMDPPVSLAQVSQTEQINTELKDKIASVQSESQKIRIQNLRLQSKIEKLQTHRMVQKDVNKSERQ